MDDFFWSRRRFEIGVFALIGVGRSQGIDETMERSIVATIRAPDGLLDAVITRDQDRVGGAHASEVRGGAGFATPLRKPFFKWLTYGKHRSKRLRIFSAGDSGEATEKEGEINLLGTEQIETFLYELVGGLGWKAEFGAESSDVLAAESLRINGESSLGDPGRLARILS